MPFLMKRGPLSLFSTKKMYLFFSVAFSILILTILIILQFQYNSSFKQQTQTTSALRDDINRHLETNLSETCRALAKQDIVLKLFSNNTAQITQSATALLNTTREILGASLIYVLDNNGTAIASSISENGESLFGNNYKFRPYFTKAIKGIDYSYAALGVTTGRRGLYFSSPILGKDNQILGVTVIKAGLDTIDKILLKAATRGPVAVLSREGVVFAASDESWLFHTSTPLDDTKHSAIIASGQFALEPILPLSINLKNKEVIYRNKNYSVLSMPISLHEWSIVTLMPQKSVLVTIVFTCLAFTIPVYFFLLKTEHFYNELRYKEKINKQNVHLTRLNKEMMKEIEERKETETKLIEVSEQELQYRLLFEQSKDAITIVAEDGKFIEANQAFLSMMDCSREEILIMKAQDFWINPADRRIWYNLLKKQGSVIDYHSKQKTRTGTILDLNLTTNATLTQKDQTVYLTILRDITDTLEDQKELLSAKTAAEQANQAKSNFLANMSHEIRTPMNGIIGMTTIVLESELQPEQHKYLEMVRSSADRLLEIINNILDFSKIEAGRLELEEIEFNLRDKLTELISLMSIKAQNKNVKLSVDIAADVPSRLLGDPTRLMQVLINLTNNAIKFTQNGNVAIGIELRSDLLSSKVSLYFTVKDSGIGVPSEKQSAIFESFSQADASTTRQYGGTGLGLTISSQLCRLMGGEIGVESNEKKGSIFWFTADFNLPDKMRREQSLKHGKTISSELTREEIFRDIRVLLAEDDFINQTLAVAVLEKAQIKVTTANNGFEAVEKSKRNTYDLILMDIQMPEIDGYEATKIIREQEKVYTRHTPIIAMTAHAIKGDREKCLQAGMDDYITKPIDPLKLYEAIEKHLLYRVLVADDHPISLKLAGRIFTDIGWQVTLAENMRQCMWECTHSNFDLIIADMLMPGMDIESVAMSITNRVRQTGKYTHITGLSGVIDEQLTSKCSSAGIYDLIEKPLTKERVTTLINSLSLRNTM